MVGCLNGSEDVAAITIQLRPDGRLGLRADASSQACILGESDVVRLIFTRGEADGDMLPVPSFRSTRRRRPSSSPGTRRLPGRVA